MKQIHSGSSTLPLVQCVDRRCGTWLVLWDKEVAESDGDAEEYVYWSERFGHRPTLAEVKETILAWYNKRIDARILGGFEWRGMTVWLSSENQFNYKAAYDLAVQTGGATLPVTFKFGTTDEPQYHTFETVEELTAFYTSAMAYINGVLADGWREKDGLDWREYEQLLEAV